MKKQPEQLPRRLVEREYLAVLLDAVSMASWREIVARAVEQAKDGDADARQWLSRQILSTKVTDLAADEANGIDADADFELRRRMRRQNRRVVDVVLRHQQRK